METGSIQFEIKYTWVTPTHRCGPPVRTTLSTGWLTWGCVHPVRSRTALLGTTRPWRTPIHPQAGIDHLVSYSPSSLGICV